MKELESTKVNESTSPDCGKPVVSGSAFTGYRFKATSKQNGSTLGTGFMTSSRKLNELEQMDLFHNWTNGRYFNSENYVSVSVFKADR